MRNSLKIFINDLKNIGTNWVALLIIGGLVFLPSLYAWLNIYASWDPYGNTDQLPVGVVNEDKGEVVRDEDIDVGEELVDTLKDDDSMDWTFTDRESAMEQLEEGDLFAFIVIPEDFSKKLGTVVEAHPEKAKVEYYVNEKLNAIAPKITEKGASVIVDDISSNFISTVNGIIFDIFNEIGLELEEELPDIRKFEDYVFDAEKRLPDIHETLDDTLSDASKAQNIVGKIKKELPNVESGVDSGLDTVDRVTDVLEEAEKRVTKIGPRLKDEIAKAKEHITEVDRVIEEIDESDIDFEEDLGIIGDIEKDVEEAISSLENIEETLQNILRKMENDDEQNEEHIALLKEVLDHVAELNGILHNSNEYTDALTTLMNEKKEDFDEILSSIRDITSGAEDRLTELEQVYEETIEPVVLEEIADAEKTLANAKRILRDVQKTIPEVDELLNRTSDSLDEGEDLLEDVLAEYPYVYDKVTELADKIRDIQNEADIHEIIDLLQNDPDAEKGFFEEPVTLNENKVFSIENYGTGMTPFYTILSLWVGGILLISLLTTDVTHPEQFNLREVYFGKKFTFVLIGFLQSIIVTLGDLFLIQVEIVNPVWFVIFGLFASFIFMTVIYTFVSIFGDVGKAAAIILLVLQIAGSGGTYPVVLLPKFFQMISPFLPFTYAIGLMREAVGGIIWSNALTDVLMLALFGVIAIIFGALLKGPINAHTNKLVKKSKESGVFH